MRSRSGALLSSLTLFVLCGCGDHHPPIANADAREAASTAEANEDVIVLPREAHAFVHVEPAALAEDVTILRVPGRVAFRDGGAADVAATIPGRIVEVHVAVGDRVTRGAPLATIRSPEALVVRTEARRADLALRASEAELSRARRLVEAGVQTDREVLDAELRRNEADAERARAVAARGLLGGGASGDTIVLRAPIDGVVFERHATRGMVVAGDGAPLFRVGDPAAVWVEAEIFERDIASVHVGSAVRVALPSTPELRGRVASIGSVVDVARRTATARIIVDDAPAGVRPGMYGRVEIGAPTPTLVVPTTAVIVRNGRELDVFVEPEARSFRFERRVITIGTSHEGKVAVLTGLSAGERIVTRGALLLDGSADLVL